MQTVRVAQAVGARPETMTVKSPRRRRLPASALFAAFGISLVIGSLVFAVLQA